MREVGVEVVDVGPGHVCDGGVLGPLPVEAEEDDGDVAVVELDP